MTERNAKPLKVLIRQLGMNVNLNALFGKPLSVLGHTKFFEPVRNLLHRGHQRSPRELIEFSTTGTESLHRYVRDITRRNMQYRAARRYRSLAPSIDVLASWSCWPIAK